jgi:hypothetical protein
MALTNFECGNKLGESNKEEIQVEEELELLIKDYGQEGEGVVFLVANNVWREAAL